MNKTIRIYIYPTDDQIKILDEHLEKLRMFDIRLREDFFLMLKRKELEFPLMSDYKRDLDYLEDIDSHAVRCFYRRYEMLPEPQRLPPIPTDEQAKIFTSYFTRSESIKFKCDKGLFIPKIGFVEMDGDEQDEEEIHSCLYVNREDKREGDGFEYFVTMTKVEYIYPDQL